MLKRLILMCMMLAMINPVLAAPIDSRYSIVIEENGLAGVVVELDGKGLISLPVPADVSEIKVKGGLYSISNDTIDISIGSTEKAVLLYKTWMLTSKQGDSWNLDMHFPTGSAAVVALPRNAEILSTEPSALIDSGSFSKLTFLNATGINVRYSFRMDSQSITPYIAGGLGIAMLAAGIFLLKQKKPSNKGKILKTLSPNEKLIVQALIENQGAIRRNDLEKLTKMAKSSLANTLNNLEKKNIIEIDKTYTVHFIRFTGWFDEL